MLALGDSISSIFAINSMIPVLGFTRPRAVKVFLSHKDSDKKICTKIKEDLEREFDDDIDIFLSSDAKCIRSGDEWRKRIEKNLREADWLFFLYLNPRQVWDWCFFEAGFFLGFGDNKGRRDKLVMLHPDGVLPPKPFADIQSAGANAADIEQKLRQMLAKTPSGRDKTDWRRIAESIAHDVQAAALQFFDGRYQLTVECPMIVNPKDPFDVKVDVEKATVCVKGASRDLLGIGVETGISWYHFGMHLNGKRTPPETNWDRAFDFYALEAAALGIGRNKHLGEAELQSFRVGNDGYRPIITGAELDSGGTVHLTLYLVKIPDSLDARATNSFDTIYQSLSLGCQLRRDVVETNDSGLEALTPGDPRAKELLTNLWRSLESVVTDSFNRGLTPERTREAFGETRVPALEDLIEKWEKLSPALKEATEKVDVQRCKELITVLRHINFQYLKLADTRLMQLLDKVDMPKIDTLPESVKQMLPTASLQDPTYRLPVERGVAGDPSPGAIEPSSNEIDAAGSVALMTKPKKKAARKNTASKKSARDEDNHTKEEDNHGKKVRRGKPR